MILDIEGSPAARAISGRLWWMLSAASASVAIAVLLGLNALPHNQLARFVPARRNDLAAARLAMEACAPGS